MVMQKRKYKIPEKTKKEEYVNCAECIYNKHYNNFCWDFTIQNWMWWCIFYDYARPQGKNKRKDYCKFTKIPSLIKQTS